MVNIQTKYFYRMNGSCAKIRLMQKYIYSSLIQVYVNTPYITHNTHKHTHRLKTVIFIFLMLLLLFYKMSKDVECWVHDISVNNIHYADDMVLLSPRVKAFKVLSHTCEEYIKLHGITYNGKNTMRPGANYPKMFLFLWRERNVYRYPRA